MPADLFVNTILYVVCMCSTAPVQESHTQRLRVAQVILVRRMHLPCVQSRKYKKSMS